MLDIRPLTNTRFVNSLSHPVGCLFTFLMFSEAQKSLILMKSKFFFNFVAYIFGVIYKNPLPYPSHEELFPYFILSVL